MVCSALASVVMALQNNPSFNWTHAAAILLPVIPAIIASLPSWSTIWASLKQCRPCRGKQPMSFHSSLKFSQWHDDSACTLRASTYS